MSVLLVTDDADDDISIDSKETFYKQLKDLNYDFNFTSSSSSLSPSILVQSNSHYRQHRRRRRRCCRSQQCLLQHLLTYMYTLFILTNQLHWSVIIFSLSSMKIMSTHASTTISKRPLITPSIKSTTNHFIETNNEQQCLPLSNSLIDRICSKTCRIGKLPFVSSDAYNPFVGEQSFLPFCSNLLNQTIIQEQFLNQTNEIECRLTLNRILEGDGKARKATELFATYLEAIDSASEQNRYSIINADCQGAYRIWACSIQIPFYYQNHLIPPCQSICDEVERVCPTYRPSDREPLFAGQPLFFCHGGIVENNDYGQRPHCFDSCHVSHGSLQRPSQPTDTSSSGSTSKSIGSFIENLVTTPPCFEIQPYLSLSDSKPSLSSLTNETLFENRTNRSRSSSAINRTISLSLSFILTFIFLDKILTTNSSS